MSVSDDSSHENFTEDMVEDSNLSDGENENLGHLKATKEPLLPFGIRMAEKCLIC